METTRVPRLLTPEELGKQLGISLWKLEQMRRDGTGPRYHRLGHRTVRYRIEDVEAWLREVRR